MFDFISFFFVTKLFFLIQIKEKFIPKLLEKYRYFVLNKPRLDVK